MPDLDHPSQQVQVQAADLKRFESFRKRTLRNHNLYGSIFGVTLAGVVLSICIFIYSESEWGDGPFVIAILACGGLSALSFFLRDHLRSQYRDRFKLEVIRPLLQSVQPGLNYYSGRGLTKAAILNSGLFTQQFDRCKGEDYLAGMYGQTHFKCAEMRLSQVQVAQKGQRTEFPVFEGLIMVADFHKYFEGHTLVLPDHAEKKFGQFGRFWQKMRLGKAKLVQLEDLEFEREFAVYSTDEVEARYILSTAMMQRILELRKQFGCQVALSFIRSFVYIAIYSWHDMFESDLKQPIDAQALQRYVWELKQCLGIIDTLNLNTRIWSKS